MCLNTIAKLTENKKKIGSKDLREASSSIAFLSSYLDVKLELVEVQSVKNTNIGKTCCDSDIFPLKMARNVPLGGWSNNHLDNFTEFVSFAVFWQNDLGCGKDSCKTDTVVEYFSGELHKPQHSIKFIFNN